MPQTVTNTIEHSCRKIKMMRFSRIPPNLRNYKQFSTRVSYKHHLGEDPLRYTTIGQLLEENALKFGHRTALVSREQNKTLTFSDALLRADKLAAGLKRLGLEKNDRLGLWAPNLEEWYLTYLACARAGLITVALNPAYQPPEIEYCINKVGIKAIVCADRFKTQDFHEILAKVVPQLEKCEPGKLKQPQVPSLQTIITTSPSEKRGAFTFEEVVHMADDNTVSSIRKNQMCVKADDPANLQFTSGTTGKPKAALASHFNIVNNSYFVGKRNELSEKHHKICVQVPFFHVFGTIASLMAALNHGATLVLPSSGYSPDKSLDALRDDKCTIIHGTPTMYVDLIHRQEKRNEKISPEIAVAGGAPCGPHLFQKMRSVLGVKKVKSIYGLTETTAVVFQSLASESEEKSFSTVGHIGEHLEVKVVDKDGVVVPHGTAGELWVRGYTTMLGYWDNEAKTKDTIEDNWLKTGDQFVLDDDGYGKVVGRLKEMIIRGGENIFPKEIEEFLITHPDILEIYVVGLPHERLGEEVCACVRIKNEAKINLGSIADFCKGSLAHFKIPTKLAVLDEFPKTMSGKIQKFKLTEIVMNSVDKK